MSQGMTTADSFRMLEPPSSRFQWWSTVVYCRKVWRVNKRCFSGTSACWHLMNRNAHHITRRWFSHVFIDFLGMDRIQRRRLSARPFPISQICGFRFGIFLDDFIRQTMTKSTITVQTVPDSTNSGNRGRICSDLGRWLSSYMGSVRLWRR